MSRKTVLILGATGGIGHAVAQRLVAGGWNVRALHRDPARVQHTGPFEWVQGDALIARDVAQAASGVDAIFHAVKPRHYRDWQAAVLPMIDNTIAAAQGARIVMPGNVYNYGPDAGTDIDEDAPQAPLTAKGKLRVTMEQRVAAAVQEGKAQALIVRAGDFFGPGANSSWFSEAMVKPGGRPSVVRNPAKPGVGHQWAYLPDLAETVAQLMDQPELPSLARFHMGGHWDADGTQMAAAIVRVLGAPAVAVRALPWWLITLVAPLMREMRELAEMKYLWDRPVRLRNARLLATLGQEPHTPLDQAVTATLRAIGCLSGP